MVKNFKYCCDGVNTASRFCYLGDRVNASGGCETAVKARTRIGWMKFRECSEILKDRRFQSKMKEKGLQKLCEISYVVWK